MHFHSQYDWQQGNCHCAIIPQILAEKVSVPKHYPVFEETPEDCMKWDVGSSWLLFSRPSLPGTNSLPTLSPVKYVFTHCYWSVYYLLFYSVLLCLAVLFSGVLYLNPYPIITNLCSVHTLYLFRNWWQSWILFCFWIVEPPWDINWMLLIKCWCPFPSWFSPWSPFQQGLVVVSCQDLTFKS